MGVAVSSSYLDVPKTTDCDVTCVVVVVVVGFVVVVFITVTEIKLGTLGSISIHISHQTPS